MATTPKKNDASTADGDVGQAEVQARFDAANDKGYFGTLPEKRDGNESFTLAAVTKGTK